MESKKPLALTILDIVSIILLGIATYLALVFAPTELVMGDVQRVFYFHIGTAWTALLGFILAAVFSVIYLIAKDLKWDRLEVAAIEVSLVFFFITIVLGSIWARPAWNTWWTWDPRLTTAAVTELIYVAYFMLRQGIDDPDKRARFGAVYALIGGLSAPITFFAIRLFRTIHPVVIGGGERRRRGRLRHDGRHAGCLLLCPVHLHRHLHRPVLEPHPPGRSAGQGGTD